LSVSRKGTVPIIAILLDVENEIKISSAGKGKGLKKNKKTKVLSVLSDR